jgi:hypothetical protein
MTQILALGPYIGSFEQEILTFRPYSRWLKEAIPHDKVYINVHSNRAFLYDFIPEENIIHVFENLSRDESGQRGYIHDKIKQADFSLIKKRFKEKIIEIEKVNKKNIDLHHLNYIQSTPPYSIYNKIFEEIKDTKIEQQSSIVFIPLRIEDEQKMRWIYKHLLDNYDVEIIGNGDTYFRSDNKILSRIDYFENGWKANIQSIINTKAVICPISYWTTIANMQSVPVFSWGNNVGQHKRGGIYNFENKKCYTVPTREDTSVQSIILMIDYFIKNIGAEHGK